MTRHFPRSLALKILQEFYDQPQPRIEEIIQKQANRENLLEGQVAWLRDICSGVLRWQGRLQVIVDHYAPRKSPSGRLGKYLQLAVYQILAQEQTADALVVNETVQQIKNLDGEVPASFANALLRKVSSEKQRWQPFPWQELGESLWQPSSSLPVWIWRRIYQERGAQWAQAFADANHQRPKLYARLQRDFKPDWARETSIPQAAEISEGGAVFEKSGFDQGQFFIQDISSQFLVHEVTQFLRSQGRAQARILDLCAAPGGKAMGLALNGFRITATDHHQERLRKVAENLQRMKLKSQVEVLPFDEQVFHQDYDLIWVDAPCTAIGTIRRHPEISYHRQEKDLTTLASIQHELGQKAIEKQKPGGYVLYSVCSVFRQEGQDRVQDWVKRLKPNLLRQWDLSPQDFPYGDGFYAALLAVN